MTPGVPGPKSSPKVESVVQLHSRIMGALHAKPKLKCWAEMLRTI